MIDDDTTGRDTGTPTPLPQRPPELADHRVAGWRQPVTMDSYLPEPPDRYPAYLDQRVYQGSSGRVYPLPFFDRIAAEPRPVSWDAVHLENDWVRLMILPGLGGRIHCALDKTKHPAYDFFYRNQVIKPALVGLAGPWIAGGVEFNWPQHHRPASFLPCSVEIEREPDGAVTVWCSDHDPMLRMKGMHGVRLRPESSLVELRVRLYNRSELTQSFLWWANVAARTHDHYQSFFPDDVTMVADHAKRAVTSFPAADRPYYGIDYPARASRVIDGVPGDRLDWYRNIDVPTSYMCVDSSGDFFGGYDHAADAGFVHVADHRIAPGKKQWTWGNAPFGRAWDRQLADDGSAYIELMAGVYTDNQPDFSWIAPGETKTFSQYWYPISGIGPVQQANTEIAIRWQQTESNGYQAQIAATKIIDGARIELRDGHGRLIAAQRTDLAPGEAARCDIRPNGPIPAGARLEIHGANGPLLDWPVPATTRPQAPEANRATESRALHPAVEPPAPEAVDSVERLWLIGVHLTQYRHATRSPVPYFEEALRRDPGHTGSLIALAEHHYRRGEYDRTSQLCRTAIERLTEWNPNPPDGKAWYLLGLAAERTGDAEIAYDAYAKATWNRAWRGPAGYRMARIDAAAGRDQSALHHLSDVTAAEPDHLQASALRVIILRRLGRGSEADRQLQDQLRTDPLHWWARDLAGLPLTTDAQTCLDVALEYAGCGEFDAALRVLQDAADADRLRDPGAPALGPMIDYYRAAWALHREDEGMADAAAAQARATDDHSCFPARLDDADVLQATIDRHPDDPTARGLFGHWLYAQDRHRDAVRQWRRAVELDPERPVIWRNLGLAAVNVDHDLATARAYYLRALELAPMDARLWHEYDRLAELAGDTAEQRLAILSEHLQQVAQRDDLTVRYAELLITTGALDQAEQLMSARAFQPWEGGEGAVLRCWDHIQLGRARRAVDDSRPEDAIAAIRRALEPPPSLGEARHPLANSAELQLALGDAQAAAGRPEQAREAWRSAADQVTDFESMASIPYSEATVSSIAALRRLGDDAAADRLTAGMVDHLDEMSGTEPTIDYFATSLPDLLLFSDDPHRARDRRVEGLRSLLADQQGARR
ncbi:DUF5107 domain-containing protein [Microlunatus soli]|uniref:Tetratricopeptide repeat-containing protein n=1 Tax=Microlunatus soli TaxID=630515 RepID=A0A1H1TE75_9ACTN|nr:DUF5107 domain-containing protein [Microlunatus soli]SDS58587.1 Tetratricopeptide repeat-containing protein [Microlunatus soli]